jgi:3-hydroxyacyl-CoA dehydrogenase
VGDEEILDRCLLSMVNEGAKILAEGVAQRASDIDVVWVHGYGWPAYRGGPMYWADQLGLDAVLDKLEALQARFGTDFAPAPLIRTLAADGRGFRDLEPRGAGPA